MAKALQNARFAPPALTPSLPAIQLPHPARTLASASTQDTGLAHAISTSLTAGTAMLARALLVVVVLVRPRPARPATVAELALDRRDEELAA